VIAAVTLYSGALCESRIPRRHGLQRLFSTFPGGWPGLGLLLLRATVGLTGTVQGGVYLADSADRTLALWAVGILAVATGALLLIGLLTPVASILMGIVSVGIAFSWVPAPNPTFSDSRLATFLVVIMAAAIGLLGPGAFSLDSHLFGRREIIIPPISRKS
jgi:uncharacterized membrane protein YphA (DoxX/SURF4 family)